MSAISNIASIPPELLANQPSTGGPASLSSVGGISSTTLQTSKREEEAYRDFEKMFVHQMLKEMRKTINETSLVEKSHATKMYEEMMDEAMADQMAMSGQLGLADQLRNSAEAERIQRELRASEKWMSRSALEPVKE